MTFTLENNSNYALFILIMNLYSSS